MQTSQTSCLILACFRCRQKARRILTGAKHQKLSLYCPSSPVSVCESRNTSSLKKPRSAITNSIDSAENLLARHAHGLAVAGAVTGLCQVPRRLVISLNYKCSWPGARPKSSPVDAHPSPFCPDFSVAQPSAESSRALHLQRNGGGVAMRPSICRSRERGCVFSNVDSHLTACR